MNMTVSQIKIIKLLSDDNITYLSPNDIGFILTVIRVNNLNQDTYILINKLLKMINTK